MGQSNEGWMSANRGDPSAFALMDECRPLPEQDEDPRFDAWLKSKHISRQALARTACRLHWANDDVLVWCSTAEYIKMRYFVGARKDGKVHITAGSLNTPPSAHIMSPKDRAADQFGTLLIPEGQTDAAWLWDRMPDCSIAVLLGGCPAGVPPGLVEKAKKYKKVYAATDNDEAGDQLAKATIAAIPRAVRMAPPAS